MALFNITRFNGESESTTEKSSQSSLILSRLNEKALKRKKEFVSTVEENISSKKGNRKDNNNDDAKPLKKKRKSKHTNEPDEVTSAAVTSRSILKKATTSDKAVDSESEDTHPDLDNLDETVSSEIGFESEEASNTVEVENDSTSQSESDDAEGELESDTAENNNDKNGSGESKPFTVIGEVLKRKKQKVERVLPHWLAHPSVVKADVRTNTTPLSEVLGLDDELVQRLKDTGIQSYFPVQAQVIPAVLDDARTGFLTGRAGYRPCDICCSAPTGSGKTLAYVLPIVQALKPRVTCQVRALVVLPVRDLAVQVFKVFQTFCEGTSLKVGAAVGLKNFHQEQRSLLHESAVSGEFVSRVDIIVATPGRLVDHINSTQGFSLSHLRYLVIDEADRMMDEIKQDWLAQVERCLFTPQGGYQRQAPGSLTAANIGKAYTPLQKLLFSATLSQNPEKLEQLGLFQPRLFTSVVKGGQGAVSTVTRTSTATMDGQANTAITEESHDSLSEHQGAVSNGPVAPVTGEFIGKYTTPAGLTEFYCPVSTAQKPLAILYFLHQLKFRNVLCFTNSVEVTHRLFWLLKLVGGVEVKEFSSKQHAQKRAKLVTQFKAGKIHVLVCSDAMARGMDISNVRYVISYERAPFLKTYIHRVGRTARAGKVGTAITLLEKKEIYHFKKMLKEAGKTSVKEMRLSKADLKPFVEPLSDSLKQLPEIIKSEKQKR